MCFLFICSWKRNKDSIRLLLWSDTVVTISVLKWIHDVTTLIYIKDNGCIWKNKIKKKTIKRILLFWTLVSFFSSYYNCSILPIIYNYAPYNFCKKIFCNTLWYTSTDEKKSINIAYITFQTFRPVSNQMEYAFYLSKQLNNSWMWECC